MVDGRGIPLSIAAAGANRHDMNLLEPTLKKVVRRKKSRKQGNLCADKGYYGKPAERLMRAYGYIPHVRTRGQEVSEKKVNPRYKSRRWVVERTHSWLNRYRKILVRYEKKAASYEALLELACALIVFRQTTTIYG